MILKGKIISGGGSSSGLFKLKKPIFKLGELLMLKILEPSINDTFYSNIRIVDGKQSIHVPKQIVKDNNLMGGHLSVQLEPVSGFAPRVGSGGRIYLPLDYAKKLKLKNDEIIALNIKQSNVYRTFYTRVRTREKKSKEEFYCFTDIEPKKSILATISKTSVSGISKKSVLKDFNHVFVDSDNAIVFDGHSSPVIFNAKTNLADLSYFLGAYFADGTKKGNSWAICASTKAQANYYYSMHLLLFPKSKMSYTISFTDTKNRGLKQLSKFLEKEWSSALRFDLTNCKCRIISSNSYSPLKLNEFGTLILKENRGIMLKIYAKLLDDLFKNGTPAMALDFILGTLEGDGTVNAKKRGHIQILTNKDDHQQISLMLDKARIKYSFIHEKSKNKYYFRIGALEILRHFSDIKGKIFQYYPKRRKSLINRLFSTGAVNFIVGKQQNASSWVKAELKNHGFVGKKYLLTKKGLKLKESLLDMKKEFVLGAGEK